LGGEAMTPFLARLLEISLKNIPIQRDWKITRVVHIYEGGYRSNLSK
jgi:hypothetical protein